MRIIYLHRLHLVAVVTAFLATACGDPPQRKPPILTETRPDAGTTPKDRMDAAGSTDAATDLGSRDVGAADFGTPDFGNPDFGSPDFGSPDFGSPDFGNPDFGTPDFGNPDFGNPDFGSPDFGNPDFGTPDFGNPDLGNPDFGNPDFGNPDFGNPDFGKPDLGAPDFGAPDFGTPDMGPGDMGTFDAGPSYGTPCPVSSMDPFPGVCDPVSGTGCATSECIIALQIQGPDVVISSTCTSDPKYSLQEGENCIGTTERCAPGLFCVSFIGVCTPLCWMTDGEGCSAGEFCRRPSSDWNEIGYCTDTCN